LEPENDQTPIDFENDVEVIADDGVPDHVDELYAPANDEEMSGGPDEEDDDDEDDEASLDDESEDDESEIDEGEAEKLELRRKVAEYDQLQQRLNYNAQQQRNKAYWDGIERQAEEAFAAKYDQIDIDATDYHDPEAYKRQKRGELQNEMKVWYREFNASQTQARAKAQERAAIPVYAAKLATHYGLSVEQAHELLEYDPSRMDYEAQKLARHNAQITRLKKRNQQTQRGNARVGMAQNPVSSGGSGRAAPIRVKAGSDNHLLAIFGAAKHARQGK
jgi:hypothetical protein